MKYYTNNQYIRFIDGDSLIDAIESNAHKIADKIGLGNAAGTHIDHITFIAHPQSTIDNKTYVEVKFTGRGLDLAHKHVDQSFIHKSLYVYCDQQTALTINSHVIYSK